MAAIADGCDGAFSNLKYEAHAHNKDEDEWFKGCCCPEGSRITITCGNHGNRLVETYTKDSIDDLDAMSKLGQFLSLMRSGGYYLRLVAVVFPTLLQPGVIQFTDADPDPSDNVLARALVDHWIFHRGRFDAACANADAVKKNSIRNAELVALRDELLANAVFLGGGGIIVRNGASMSKGQQQRRVATISKLVVSLLLKSVPGKPEIGKWTKDAPAVDWWTCLQTLLPLDKLVDAAYGDIRVTVSDGTNMKDMGFHEASGLGIVSSSRFCF